MKLIWNGHSCFTLATEAGTLVIDPYEDGSVPGLSPSIWRLTPSIAATSTGTTATGPRWPSAGSPVPWEVEELATWHDEVQGAKRGPNTMRIFSAEGLRVAHLGDLGCGLTPEPGRGPVRSGRSAHPGGRLLHHRCRPGQGGSGPAQAPGGRSHALPRQGLRLRGHRFGGVLALQSGVVR